MVKTDFVWKSLKASEVRRFYAKKEVFSSVKYLRHESIFDESRNLGDKP